MAYTTQQAIETLNGYLSINENDKKYIDDTKKEVSYLNYRLVKGL